ncbi:MAG: DUF222 domain-containing protein [Acidimicrobiales bacterium]
MELVVTKSSTQELMAEAERLGTEIAASMGALMAIIGELDRREGWRSEGATSLASWLAQRCGISESTGRAWAHVAERLDDLPHLAQGLKVGALSYDKVRAAVDLATPETDASVLRQAEECSVRQLRDLVRADQDATDAKAASDHETRYLRFNDASCSLQARMPNDAYAVVRSAITEGARAFPSDGETPYDQRQCDALIELCRMARGIRTTQGSRAAAGRRNRTGTAGASGMSGASGAAGSVGRAAGAPHSADTPHEPGSLNREYDGDLGDIGDFGDLDIDALGIPTGSIGPTSTQGFFVVAHTDLSLLRGGTGTAEIERFGLLSGETIRRITCDASVALALDDAFGHTMFEGRSRRYPSGPQRREAFRRDRRCRFPGCTNSTFTDVHHVVHWADEGPTDLENLVTLCNHHHHRVHSREWTVLGNANGVLRFTGPTGRTMTSRPSPLWTKRKERSGSGAVRP